MLGVLTPQIKPVCFFSVPLCSFLFPSGLFRSPLFFFLFFVFFFLFLSFFVCLLLLLFLISFVLFLLGVLTPQIKHVCFYFLFGFFSFFFLFFSFVVFLSFVFSSFSFPSLLSYLSQDCDFFYFNKLPFLEDIRQYPFGPLSGPALKKEFQPSQSQLDAAEMLIRNLDLMSAATNENG